MCRHTRGELRATSESLSSTLVLQPTPTNVVILPFLLYWDPELFWVSWEKKRWKPRPSNKKGRRRGRETTTRRISLFVSILVSSVILSLLVGMIMLRRSRDTFGNAVFHTNTQLFIYQAWLNKRYQNSRWFRFQRLDALHGGDVVFTVKIVASRTQRKK